MTTPLGRRSCDHWSSATALHDEPEPLIATYVVALAGCAAATRPIRHSPVVAATRPGTRAERSFTVFSFVSGADLRAGAVAAGAPGRPTRTPATTLRSKWPCRRR